MYCASNYAFLIFVPLNRTGSTLYITLLLIEQSAVCTTKK